MGCWTKKICVDLLRAILVHLGWDYMGRQSCKMKRDRWGLGMLVEHLDPTIPETHALHMSQYLSFLCFYQFWLVFCQLLLNYSDLYKQSCAFFTNEQELLYFSALLTRKWRPSPLVIRCFEFLKIQSLLAVFCLGTASIPCLGMDLLFPISWEVGVYNIHHRLGAKTLLIWKKEKPYSKTVQSVWSSQFTEKEIQITSRRLKDV